MSRGGTRHSLEQRLEIVTKYLSGQDSVTQLSNDYGVSESAIKSWYHKYESKGIDGLKKTHKNKKYDPKFKLEMVHKVLSGELGLCECCREFNLPSPSMLSNWVKHYNSGKDFKANNRSYTTMKHKVKAAKTTYDQRLEIVLDTIKNGKDYRLCADKYHVSYSQVYNWVRKYERFGTEGLKDRRGKSLKQQPEEILSAEQKLKLRIQKLEEEKQLLEAENYYLKKVRALGNKKK